MKIKHLMLLAAGLTCVSNTAFASSYFNNPFDTAPTLGPTAAPGIWYTDRYNPADFDSQLFGGSNRLHIGISSDDGVGANATGGGRPGSYTSSFYNTQGRAYDLGNGFYTSIRAKLYVGADWATNHRRSDMWGVMADGANVVTTYPIIGFANITGSSLMCRAYTVDTDQNPGNGNTSDWVDLSSKVPGGITTNRWYDIEIRLKPGTFEYRIDGQVVFSDQMINGAVQFKSVIMQAYNFNDPALAPVNQTSFESYDVYWDDLTASPVEKQGFPIDLNGSYRSASGGPLDHDGSPTRSDSGFAIAATVPIDFGGGYVFERNGVNAAAENVVNGSFTPFNDTTKQPNMVNIANVNNTSMEADVSLSGYWKPFQWGGGPGVPFATGDVFGLAWVNTANSFGVQIVTDPSNQFVARLARIQTGTGSLGILDGSQHTFPAGTTRIRVNASMVLGSLTATVMPLDGPDAYVVSPLGSTDGTTLTGGGAGLITTTFCSFVAGFETMEHIAAAANATVSNFTTDANANVLFLAADDPYVRWGESINYRVGQANLSQTVNGFQAFMSALAGQTFASGSYSGPYNIFNPGAISSVLDAAGAGGSPNQANLTVANLVFTAGASDAARVSFRPNTGTEENKFAGGPPDYFDVMALTENSNRVVIDDTDPVLTVPVLGGSSWIAPNAVVGTLTITSDATDLGTHQSGLDGRPAGSITWSDASVTPITTVSLIGNTFRATIPITASTPNGTATLNLQVCDRAGNCSTQSIVFNVSTVNIALTIRERGVTSNVTRYVRITLGGSVGSGSDAITVKKNVSFNTPVVVMGDPSREGTTLVTYQDLDLYDNGIADNSVPANADLTLVYVKDAFFSLGKKETLSGTTGNLSATVTLRMGDVTDNNIVNVSDLAVWAANNGSGQNPNTTDTQPAIPRQANVDGTGGVDLGDRNLIISAWLLAGDTLPGDFGTYLPGPGLGDGSQTVEEVVAETGLDKLLVLSMDLNSNGRITREEVLRWSRGGGKG